ncbi:hypothetical protein H1C71_007972 [Ictidomys tridecemlineatus]|nr:hypothetical protein H1C71_007972 [Ictidomys tridecemlineatus]
METSTQLCPCLKECVGRERGHLRKTARFPDPPSTNPETTMGWSPAWPSISLVPRRPDWTSGGPRQWALEEPPGLALALEDQVRAHQDHGELQEGQHGRAPGGILRPSRRSPGRWFPASTSVGPALFQMPCSPTQWRRVMELAMEQEERRPEGRGALRAQPGTDPVHGSGGLASSPRGACGNTPHGGGVSRNTAVIGDPPGFQELLHVSPWPGPHGLRPLHRTRARTRLPPPSPRRQSPELCHGLGGATQLVQGTTILCLRLQDPFSLPALRSLSLLGGAAKRGGWLSDPLSQEHLSHTPTALACHSSPQDAELGLPPQIGLFCVCLWVGIPAMGWLEVLYCPSPGKRTAL